MTETPWSYPMASPIDDGIRAEDLGNVLFIGVGGVGMSGLARLYAGRGIAVSGSELHDWPSLPALAELGVTIHREHTPANLDGIDTVVRSTVHPDDHIELAEARRRGLRILHRSQALAAAMTGWNSIVVAGTHGKTTTTAMITELLERCGFEPSFVNGGENAADGRSGAAGARPYFVAEADESDRSFLRYRPHTAVLTNIDADHLNTYGDIEHLEEAFADFARGTVADGAIIVCADDERAARVGERLRGEGRTVLGYGHSASADLRVDKMVTDLSGVRYQAAFREDDLGEFTLPVPSAVLGLNSAAAVLTGVHLGIPAADIRAALAGFGGVRRRFELRGIAGEVRVYDEYAYHPTAMVPTLSTMKELSAGNRLIVVFQPLRVYRTRELRAELAAALGIADRAVVMEVFGPGEELPPGDGGAPLCRAIPLPDEDKVFIERWQDVPAAVAAWATPGDLVVTMGAPPISLMPDDILAALGT